MLTLAVVERLLFFFPNLFINFEIRPDVPPDFHHPSSFQLLFNQKAVEHLSTRDGDSSLQLELESY